MVATHTFFKSIKNDSKFLWPMLSAETSRENISKYIESPNEYNSWQFTFWFLIIRLLVKWLWHGRSNYAVQYIKKI